MGCGSGCGSSVSIGGGGGGVPGITQIDTGNTVWVDDVFGNDGTGTVNRQDLPFLTIQAACNAAAGSPAPFPTVVVRPGTYTEQVVLPVAVNVVGVCRETTIIANTLLLAGTTLTMATTCSVANMTIIGEGGPATTAVLFDGTTLSSATLVNCLVIGGSAQSGVFFTGTGNAGDTTVNLNHVIIQNRNDTALLQNNGIARIRDVLLFGRTGYNLDRGTCVVEDCHMVGQTVGFRINTLGIAQLDNATRWNTLANAGTLTYDNKGISPEYIPANLVDWGGVAPVNVATALDRIAAALGPIP